MTPLEVQTFVVPDGQFASGHVTGCEGLHKREQLPAPGCVCPLGVVDGIHTLKPVHDPPGLLVPQAVLLCTK